MNREEVFILALNKGIYYNNCIFNLNFTLSYLSSDEYTSAKYIKAKDLQEEKEALLEQERRNNKYNLRLKEIGILVFHYLII